MNSLLVLVSFRVFVDTNNTDSCWSAILLSHHQTECLFFSYPGTGGEQTEVEVSKQEAKLLIEDFDPSKEYNFKIIAVSGSQQSKPLQAKHEGKRRWLHSLTAGAEFDWSCRFQKGSACPHTEGLQKQHHIIKRQINWTEVQQPEDMAATLNHIKLLFWRQPVMSQRVSFTNSDWSNTCCDITDWGCGTAALLKRDSELKCHEGIRAALYERPHEQSERSRCVAPLVWRIHLCVLAPPARLLSPQSSRCILGFETSFKMERWVWRTVNP